MEGGGRCQGQGLNEELFFSEYKVSVGQDEDVLRSAIRCAYSLKYRTVHITSF